MDWLVSTRGPTRSTPNGLSRRQLLLLGFVSCIAVPSAFASEGSRPGSFAAIAGDANGTIDLDKAKRAAEIRFRHLDRHRVGKLSHAELGRRRLTVPEFSWADRDHDGTLDQDEYLALVERQFKAADVNHDGVIIRAEFESRSGLPLRRLLY